MPVMITSSGACGASCATARAIFFLPRGSTARFPDDDNFRGVMHWIVAPKAQQLPPHLPSICLSPGQTGKLGRHEEVSGTYGTRSAGSGHFSGRRRRARVLGFCRRTAPGLPRIGRHVRRYAGRGIRPPAATDRTLSPEVWRTHSLDPAPGRARICGTSGPLADPADAHRRRPKEASTMEVETRLFYEKAAALTQ